MTPVSSPQQRASWACSAPPDRPTYSDERNCGLRLLFAAAQESDSDEEGDTTIAAEVTDNGDGSYNVTYTPQIAGVYLLRISRNGLPMPYSATRTLVHVYPTKLHGEALLRPQPRRPPISGRPIDIQCRPAARALAGPAV